MRNTTKLYHLLKLYDVTLTRGELLTLIIVNKTTGSTYKFEGKNYTVVMQQAYSFIKSRELRDKIKNWVKAFFSY